MNMQLNIWQDKTREFIWWGVGDFEFISSNSHIQLIKILFDIKCDHQKHTYKSKMVLKFLLTLNIIKIYSCKPGRTLSGNEMSEFLKKIEKEHK